jgi:tryptophan-rich sensory protein
MILRQVRDIVRREPSMSVDTTTPQGSIAPVVGVPRAASRRATWRSLVVLLVSLAVTATFATVGAVIVAFAREPWYDNLRQPAWAPPGWVYAPVAIVLHLLVGVAGWRIWVRGTGSSALTLWVVQLGLGLGWTVLFFGLWVPRWALAEAAVLVLVVVATVLTAWPRSRLAAMLLLPYLAWIIALMTLNAAIITLN